MTFGHVKDSASMLDLKVVQLSLDALLARLNHIDVNAYYPLIETQYVLAVGTLRRVLEL